MCNPHVLASEKGPDARRSPYRRMRRAAKHAAVRRKGSNAADGALIGREVVEETGVEPVPND